jgi:ligand-binding sensor domain-containing protein
MQLNIKSVTAIAVIVIGLAVGIYVIKVKQTSTAPAETTGSNQPGAVMPPGHPEVSRGDPSGNQQGNSRIGKATEDPKAKFTHFRVGNSNVKSIFIDGKEVWVGTSGGLIRYDTATDEFRYFDQRDGLLSKGIFDVIKVDGRILAGTYGGGMSFFDKASNRWDENYNVPDGLGDAFVYKSLKASNGDTWIATWSGANRIRGGNLKDSSKWDVFTVENTKGGLPNDWVYSVAEGKDGEIWFATEGGPAMYKDGKWQHWLKVGAPYSKVKNDPKFGVDPAKYSEHHAMQAKEMGLQGMSAAGAYNPNYIVSLLVDRDGSVWCGTWGGGLAHYDGKKWSNFTMSDGLPGNLIFMLNRDPSGQLWIGTNNGVAVVDGNMEKGKKLKVLTTSDGLFSNVVFSMATAPDGSKWLGSWGGVTHLK